jgi:ATP-dependent helicase HrpA
LTGFLYPALLVGEAERVSLVLIEDQGRAKEMTREGMLALYTQEFKKQVKLLKKECAIPRGNWALYEGLASHEEINRAIYQFILETIFALTNGRIHSQEVFAATVSLVGREGLLRLAQKHFQSIVNILEERRLTLDELNRFKESGTKPAGDSKRFKEYRQQLNKIVPPDFLTTLPAGFLASIPRYLKALRLRIERAHVSPAKDQAKAAQLTKHEERLGRCLSLAAPNEECSRFISEYREMLEEFKVSLFAQELKTAYPVSGKRLDKKWRDIEKHCL